MIIIIGAFQSLFLLRLCQNENIILTMILTYAKGDKVDDGERTHEEWRVHNTIRALGKKQCYISVIFTNQFVARQKQTKINHQRKLAIL